MNLFRPALRIAAFVMLLWGTAMLLPIAVDPGHLTGFAASAGLCFLLAALLHFVGSGPLSSIQPRMLFMITAFNWLLLCLTGTLPFLLVGTDIGFTNAFFETVSGVTTTGSSVFASFDTMPTGLLLWRALTHFVGGIGIIIVAVAILPSLKVGGMRLFRSESSEWSHLEQGRITSLATHILLAYTLLNLACLLTFRLLGMSWFDAICHAMSAVSTGGFSNYGDSFARFNYNHMQAAASLFMFLGACPLLLITASVVQGSPLLIRNSQVRLLLLLILLNTAFVTWWRHARDPGQDLLQLAESSLFNITAVISTTGFASEDYTLWGSFPVLIFCFLMFCGGCSGSTAGGIKLFRFQLLGIFMREHIHAALHPAGIWHRRYNDRPIPEDVLVSALAFLFFVIVSWSVCSCLLAATGLDPVTSASGALTALMNVGPGFGATIGPVGNFGSLPDTAKYILAAAMLLGRLEYLALVILFTREYWKW